MTYNRKGQSSPTIMQTQSLRGSPAARALLECVSESIFYGAISFPRPTLEASDVIQNKEFFIIYTKVVHFKKLRFTNSADPLRKLLWVHQRALCECFSRQPPGRRTRDTPLWPFTRHLHWLGKLTLLFTRLDKANQGVLDNIKNNYLLRTNL